MSPLRFHRPKMPNYAWIDVLSLQNLLASWDTMQSSNNPNPTRFVQVLKHIVTEVGSSGQAPDNYQDFLRRLAGPVCIHSILTVGSTVLVL